MKRPTVAILALLIALSLAACGNADTDVEIPSQFPSLQEGGGQAAPSPTPSTSNEVTAPLIAREPYPFDQLAEAPASDFDYEPSQATGGMMITKYNGSLTGLRIPATLEGESVTAIGAGAFSNSAVEAVYVPEGLVSVGEGAFRNCKALTDISLPDSIAEISGAIFNTETSVAYKDLVFGGNEVVSVVALHEYGYELMQFGGYNWLVLERAGDKALLLSVGVIGDRTYSPGMAETTWEGSKIRQWLNEDFYNSISPEEREKIADTLVANKANSWYGTGGGNDTTDKIFLLSIEEVVQYFGDSGQLAEKPSGATQYIDDEYNGARIAYATGGASWWWLRSLGNAGNRAVFVGRSGDIDVYGLGVGSSNRGVRPALWLNLP